MDDQWFLDLDGVRSGPYHTNEVLSLIAEGEVLPHHRIARGLKDLEWMTILDWRLDRAKIPHSAAPVAPVKESVPEPEPRKVAAPTDSVRTVPARDPMAEMFDTLQTAKQKREARQLQHAQQASANDSSAGQERSPSPATIAMICAGLAVAGVAIGQWFKNVSGPKDTETAVASPTPEATPAPSAEPETEVLEHSTDKVTIRTVVEKRPEAIKVPPPFPRLESERPAPNAPTPEPTPEPTPTPEETPPGEEKKAADKELEELRDLKKELKELKALKEQLRDGVQEDGFGDGFAPPPKGPDPAPGNPGGY